MPSYDSVRFSPPAPLATVTLQNSESNAAWEGVPMLLDSGADVTLLPQECLQRLSPSVASDELYELAAFDGTRSVAQGVFLDMIFAGQRFRGRFLVMQTDVGIIGRDILNHFRINLDGPTLVWNAERS